MTIAQDTQFSQYYNTPNYMNPALVGAGSPHWRGIVHSRWQWTGLEAQSFSNMVSAEKSINSINSGVGGYILIDNYGKSTLNKYTVNLQYAYTATINDNISLKSGVTAGFILHQINEGSLVFPNEYDSFGLTGASSGENFQKSTSISPDIGLGMMAYGDNYWVGVSGKHLNRPNVSFLSFNDIRYPIRFDVQIGLKIDLSETKYNRLFHQKTRKMLLPVFNYKAQNKHDQYEMGLYGIYNTLMAGVYYRGIAFKRYNSEFHNNESLIILLGYNYHNHLHISYSYDIVISKLAPVSYGAHEINISLTPLLGSKHQKRKGKPSKHLPCPVFIQAEW